jgi:hypothetical protein
MRKLAVICGLFALFVPSPLAPLFAQDQQSSSSDQNQTPPAQTQTPPGETKPVKAKRVYPLTKYELSGGYAFRTYYPNIEPKTLHLNGWYASLDWNLFTRLGIVGEAVGTGINQSGINNINGGLYGNTAVYTFLVGPQVYPLRHRKLTPFGHFLYGAGYYRNVVAPYGGFQGQVNTSWVHAWEAGGGLDLSFKEHWAVRLFQMDTTSANFFANTTAFTNRGLTRISVGIIYHFGQR